MLLYAGGLALALAPGGIYRALRSLLDRIKAVPSLSKKPGGIVVHHSATKPENQAHENAKTIDKDHKKRGFGVRYKGRVFHIAYHYLILPDGTVEQGRPERCRGGHTRSWKHNHWIGICLVGYFDPQWKNQRYRRPTAAQMKALVGLSADIMSRYGFDQNKVLPHRKVNPTQCPGRSFPMREFLTRLRAEAKKGPTPSPASEKPEGDSHV